jgi:hypothetical protein
MAIGAAQMAQATVETKLYADTYIVVDGGRIYSVLDIYAKGSHLGDAGLASVLGLSSHPVIFKTSQATAGADIFVHGGSAGNGWLPTDSAAKSWDSFITAGNRSQGVYAKVTNRAGTLIDQGVAGNWVAASSFSQMNVPGSNFIDEGTASGWFSAKGGNAYSSAAASENPFARVSLYNSYWNSVYTDLYRGADVLLTKGQMQTGRTTAAGSAVLNGTAGASLDWHWMIGRFAIEVTGKSDTEVITMQAQFNMVGRNGSGTGTETGITFSGALTTTPAYKVSNHFTFAMPSGPVPPSPPTGLAAADGTSTSGIALTWNASPLAGSYRVMRSSGGQTPVEIGSTSGTSFTDTSAVPGTLYSYFIYADGLGGASLPSNSDNGWRRLSPPTGLTATTALAGGGVNLVWSQSSGATGYKILRAPAGGTLAQIGTATASSFRDFTAAPLTIYDYSVTASCALGDSDASVVVSGSSITDCNGNGVHDADDLYPVTYVSTGNMGTLTGPTQRSSTRPITALPRSGESVTVRVDALGDLDSSSEYLIVRLSNAAVPASSVVRNLFVNDGQGCPAVAQTASFSLTSSEFLTLMGNGTGNLKIDVTPTAAVGGTDSACQSRSSVAVTLSYRIVNTSIDCNGNGLIDACEIAAGSQADCNGNGIPDACDIASGAASDVNGNAVPDSCEWLVGSPAYPTITSAIAAAPNGSVVPVLPGTYDGPINLGSKGLTLRSTGGKGVTTIRGAADGSTIRVQGGGQIEGFRIEGGGGDEEDGVRRGGVLRITGGAIIVKDCDLRGGAVGESGEGGLVFIRDASPVFQNCVLELGGAMRGGGVYAIATGAAVHVPLFDGCTIRDSVAAEGGGMYLRGAGMNPALADVNFERNTGSVLGGALFAAEGARPSLSNCRACGNTLPAVSVPGGYDEPAVNRMTDDCNADGICDADQLDSGALSDDDEDGTPDACQDCDGDGESDRYAIAQGWVPDCNGNQVPDSCDIASGVAQDCNGNQVPDSCDLQNPVLDCDANGSIDACEIADGSTTDCNANGIPDSCDIASGAVADCNRNGIPDSCDVLNQALDCDGNGLVDACEVAAGTAVDCNANGIPDSCDIASGLVPDCNLNGVPDGCDLAGGTPDCNANGIPDSCDIASGLVPDCNLNGVPDGCDLAGGAPDCNANGIPDSCDIASGLLPDCNGNGVPDACDIANGVPDCNQNGVPDTCDVASAALDCDVNGVIDSCEIAAGTAVDCNANGIPDSCDIASGTASDLNGTGVPDSCEYLVGSPAYPTLSSAVSAAPNGAVVPVLPGTYDGPVDLGSKGLTLRSTGGKGVTTIRGASTGSTVRVSGGGQIEGFFIQGGGGDTESGVRRGGALRITSGSVTIKDCDIRAGDVGSAGEGGLVFIRDAAPNFVNCRLEMGTAGLGGGVYARATTEAVYVPVFDQCLIRNNSATVGGGVFLRGNGMKPLLTGVSFEQNIGSTDGGALYSLEGARPSLSGCRACGNTVPVVVGGYDETGLNRLTDDCNADGICDADQLLSGALSDDDVDGIPDVCQDCDGDGESDRYAIAQGWVPDCNGNQIPDSCDIAAGAADCNGNGVPDSCDVQNPGFDCDSNGSIDSCETADGSAADCNANGRPDVCDIASGAALDCNANGVPDNCDVVDGADDCNANGIPDSCDIAAGREEDQDGGGVPDSCQYAAGDLTLDGVTDMADVGFILLLFDSPGPIGDLDGDGLVCTADLVLMLLYFE